MSGRNRDGEVVSDAARTERGLRVREEALALLRASGAILPQRELARMVNEVSDNVVGFGPIEFLLKDPSVIGVTCAKCDLLHNPVQMPAVGDTLQLCARG